MLKKMINQVVIEFTISPVDPLLIKSGQASVSGVDMSFVRTYCKDGKPNPFIPGSSLKGVFRSYAEKICRSVKDGTIPVCLPYVKPGDEKKGEKNQASCGLRFEEYHKNSGKKLSSPEIYAYSCPVCRIFGSHNFVGRLSTADGLLKENSSFSIETRDGVAIDRLTGGTVAGAKYDLEVLTKGDFSTQIVLRNFERWQLGLLTLILRDLADKQIRIGMGKSRGLGRISATIDKFELSYFGREPDSLKGIYAFCTPEESKSYDFFPENGNQVELPSATLVGLRYSYDLTSGWKERLDATVGDFSEYIQKCKWPAFDTLFSK